jgi:hypothetical protein
MKLHWVWDALPLFDEVVWLDMDTVLTNMDVTVEDIRGKHSGLTISLDWEVMNPRQFSSGNFIAANTPDMIEFFDEALKLTQHADVACWDQNAMREVYCRGGKWERLVCVLPHCKLGSVPVEAQPGAIAPWKPGDFLCHLTGIGNEKRIELFHKFTNGKYR